MILAFLLLIVIMKALNIYTCAQTLTIQLTSDLLEGSLQYLKRQVTSLLGYSSQIHLYREPLSTFFSLDFIIQDASINDILIQYGAVCLTYNNRQHKEEPDFYQQLPKSANDLMVVAQTCHQNRFSYDRYKIDSKMPISFIKNIALRTSMEASILYYQLRVPINEFANEETVSNTIAKLAYPNKLIILTSDEHINHQLWHEIENTSLVNFNEFYVVCIDDRKILMSRQAEWKVAEYLLSIIFKTTFKVEKKEGYQDETFLMEKNVNIVRLSKQVSTIQLRPALNISFLVGMTHSYLIFLQKSSILHVYQNSHPFDLVNTVILCCQPSNYLQEQIPILLAGQLVMYSVTRSCIILKYYSLPLGRFQNAKHFKWQKDYGMIRADTLDLISVSYRGNMIRVFYVHAPHEYIDIKQPQHDWLIFVSKLGYNVLSDGSGVFAIGGKNTTWLSIYNLHTKEKIINFSLTIFSKDILHVSFDNRYRKTLICSQQICFEHNCQGKVINIIKKGHKGTIFCYSHGGNIFQISTATFKPLESSQLRINSGILLIGNDVLSFNGGLQPGSFNTIFELKK